MGATLIATRALQMACAARPFGRLRALTWLRNDTETAFRTLWLSLLLPIALVVPTAQSFAQEVPPDWTAARQPVAEASAPPAPARVARFLLGGAAGLGLHESGHLVADGLFGVRPRLESVHFGPFPFFAITHPGQPPRREFTISSAGFWAQHVSSEILLVRHPRLRDEQAPVLKGVLAFNVLASVAYAGAALAKAGPTERDTRAIAESSRVSERWVAALILAPAVLDAWRYVQPDSRWAAWLSRGVKVGGVLLVLR